MHQRSSAHSELTFLMKMETRREITKHGKNGLSTLTARTLFSGGIANLSVTEIESTFIPIGYLLEDDYWLEYFVVIFKLEIPFLFSSGLFEIAPALHDIDLTI